SWTIGEGGEDDGTTPRPCVGRGGVERGARQPERAGAAASLEASPPAMPARRALVADVHHRSPARVPPGARRALKRLARRVALGRLSVDGEGRRDHRRRRTVTDLACRLDGQAAEHVALTVLRE